MIIFKVLRYKNFLSTGNVFTEIELNNDKITVVHGKNGSGKSTMLDAICYCLYNKAYRNINKPQLVNSINQKQCVVELEFTIGDREYLIRRGQKPTIFQIQQDGILLNQLSDNRDYQAMLEKNILKMNEKTFRQTIILGSADFVPFMQLSAQHRREIIEDLLDLQVFSVMNILLKEQFNACRTSLEELTSKSELTRRLLNAAQQHTQEMRESYEHSLEVYNGKLASYKTSNDSITKQISDLLAKRHGIKTNPKINEKSDAATKLKEKIDAKIKATEKAILFFERQDCCPTCQQGISNSIKHSRLLELQTRKTNYEDKRNELDIARRQIEIKLERQKEAEREIQSIDNSILSLNIQFNTNEKLIEQVEGEIERCSAALHSIQISKSETNQNYIDELKDIEQQKEALLEKRELLNIAATLLKDGGIKSKIIRQYITIINTTINHYLKILNFNIEFELNENFEETITSRGRDVFSYESFSEGEKMRIDLSILFTWRHVARMRNSSASNLLILDEIFDSSLDYDGIDEFVEMMHKLTAGTSAFILTPKADALVDRFDSSICFEKVRNFSRIKSNDTN